MARYAWNGSGSTLNAASDWTNLGTGAPATAVPTYGDTATIATPGLVTAQGTVAIGLLTIASDLALQGVLATGGITLNGGVLDLTGGGQLSLHGAALRSGVASLGSSAVIGGSGRFSGSLELVSPTATLLASGGALGLFGTASGAGTLAIGAGATLFDVGVAAAGLTAAFLGAGGTLALYGATAGGFAARIAGLAGADAIAITGAAYDAAAWSAGTLTLSGASGTLALTVAGSYAVGGFLALPDGAGGTVVRLAPAATTLATSAGTVTLGAAGALTLATGSGGAARVVLPGGTLALAGTLAASSLTAGGVLAVQPGGAAGVGTLAVSGTLLAVAGSALTADAVTLSGGSLALDPAASFAVGGAGGDGGTLDIAAAGSLAGAGRIAAPIRNDGTITARGGWLGLFGAVAGGGALAVAPGATLFAAGSLGAGLTVDLAGTGSELALFIPGDIAATLEGFWPGTTLDAGAALDRVSVTNHALALTAGGIDLARIPIEGDYATAQFTLRPDGSGGTLIGVVNCFAAGTRIATPQGERAVEALRPGDAVRTPEGVRPVLWTGARRLDTRAAPEARPVRIAAGALGARLPRRDLLLSPEHGVRIGGALVPAAALLDGVAVRREPAGPVAYHHIAIAPHGLLFAEGVEAESFLPAGAGAAAAFDRSSGSLPRLARPCLPRLEEGKALEAVRRALGLPAAPRPRRPGALRGHLERALPAAGGWRLEGWACDDVAEPAAPLVLLALRGAECLAAIPANRWRADLDRAGLRGGRCGFSALVPVPPSVLRLARLEDGAVLPHA